MGIDRKDVLEAWRGQPQRPLKLHEVMDSLGVGKAYQKAVSNLLKELADEGVLEKMRDHSYQPTLPGKSIVSEAPRLDFKAEPPARVESRRRKEKPRAAPPQRRAPAKSAATFRAKLQVTRRGFGYAIPEPGEFPEDVLIERSNLMGAMDGDRIEVRCLEGQRGRHTGVIVNVVERAHEKVVGKFLHDPRGGLVLPKNPRIKRAIQIARRHSKDEIPEGSWVVTKITRFPSDSNEPLLGEVTEVLGQEDAPGMDILLILRDFGVVPEFPEEVLQAATKLPHRPQPQDFEGRKDFRSLVTFTIDPLTAKDFDDALSVEPLGNGLIRLGVHIADVSHYVLEGSPLDLEARDRATSIYPVDRVVPMLPESLSAQLCSLRPNEDRLTMSAIMDVDRSGTVRRAELSNSIIHSKHRLTYEEVQAVLDRSDPAIVKRYEALRPSLELLTELRKTLTDMRLRRGALDLDMPETEVIFDEKGEVEDVLRKPRLTSHQIVEECMLLANETVATWLTKQKSPLIYRVHDEPNPERVMALSPVLAIFGIRLRARQGISSQQLQQALNKASNHPAEFVLKRLILRSLMRAEYRAENEGHFGLGSECYCHFTSPIRRYPDLVVHRVLKETLASPGQTLTKNRRDKLAEVLPQWSRLSSERERRAQEIEWDATDVKGMKFMERHVGDDFTGVIAGVMRHGFFVELEKFPVEGFVAVRNLEDDYYAINELGTALKGRRKGKIYGLGDRVVVQVEKVDTLAGQMDLGLRKKLSSQKLAM
ncbi:MAG: ribonuclease R [bacterium]